ncbi:hypothetical protein [Shewanella sp. GutDb-MelDb]|uniref:hypothetical protein n=1 Tax=Shewanella sp. GutDb-MelDb TaxID=2058316 RepID=UPI000C79A105|nr:hypothetical protein [Shewanella sp. GutDb-MelDb]PKG58837.1 hypothetical protein CXF82_02355 [Shewanella sp. GutDb-MelDb]
MDIRINKWWLFCGVVLLVMSALGFYYESVWVYEKVKGLSSISKYENRFMYWNSIFMYFNGFLLCLFMAAKEHYPYKLWYLMSINTKTKLSFSQVAFALTLAALYFGSSFYIAGQLGHGT